MNENETLEMLSIEYLKSYFSINSYIGCTINCAYCFLAPIKIVPMRPIKVIDEYKLIDKMLLNPYFETDKTVISINNRTDPFINNEVKKSTFKLLEIMDNRGLKNIVTITSKGLLTKDDAKYLDKFKNIKIVIIVTYNGIPKNIQPIDQSIQEQTMKNISSCKNVKLLHQFRPIIPGINDDEKVIRSVINYAKKYCNATIYQGIRVNKFIHKRLLNRNYLYEGNFDQHKQKSREVDSVFNKIFNEDDSYSIFDHTSCCLSYLFDDFDYNLHFLKYNCNTSCPNINKCKNYCLNLPNNIKDILKKIGIKCSYEICDGVLNIYGSLSDEQKSYIKHNLRLPVKSETRENTFSEKLMEDNYEYKNIL